MEKQTLTVEELYQIIENMSKTIETLSSENAKLQETIRLFLVKKYRPSKESVNPNQLSFFNEIEETANLEIEEPLLTEVKAHYRKPKKHLMTDKLPENLPVEIVEHTLPEEECVCPECKNQMHVMGKETREELKIIPAQTLIVKHIRNIYSCRNCEANSDHTPIIKANTPNPVIKGGFASPEAIAHIATQKFVMASPLYRQEQELNHNGILLSRQTMSNWLIKASEQWLTPIYEKLKEKLVEHEVLHADETKVQVLKESGKKAETNSYMWLYRTSGDAKSSIILYEYQPNRKHEHPKNFLENFKGYLHTDGYEAYHKLPDDIISVGCLAHLRRKFVDALKAIPKDKQKNSPAAKAVAYCDKLFEFERSFAKLSNYQRKLKRDELSKPVYDEFYTWLEELYALPQSLLGKAVGYSMSQKKYMDRYFLDGRLEISNNRAERCIRKFVIGRNNWLFSNTPNGAKASSIYYSLILTAIENELNPYEYLTWVFRNMPNLGKTGYAANIEELLPGSEVLPKNVCIPFPKQEEKREFAWEEK